MMYTRPPTEAMAACRRGAFMGAWRTHCLRERSYSSTEHRWGEPFTTHTFPCTCRTVVGLHALMDEDCSTLDPKQCIE